MSEDGYKIQASVKFGANLTGLLNVRGNDKEDLLENLAAAADSVGALAVLTTALEDEFPAVQVVAQTFPGTTQATNQGGTVSARSCVHGAMQYRSGAGWAGWFCPLQKSDPNRCKPVYDQQTPR